VPLKQLKLEYKEYESKRNLLAMYDMFLADARIVRLLPSHLGRHFFKRKRLILWQIYQFYILSMRIQDLSMLKFLLLIDIKQCHHHSSVAFTVYIL